MTSTLLMKVERFRYFAILLVTLCAYTTAFAQGATSDEINAAIVTDSDVELTWTNDAEHPWIVNTPSSGTGIEVKTPIDEDNLAFTSILKFSFSTDKETYITFDWFRQLPVEGDDLTLTVDGKEVSYITGDGGWQGDAHIIFEVGSHIVEFKSTSNDKYNHGDGYCSAIKNICVKKINWDEVTVEAPGQFVSSLVDVMGDRSMLDIEFLRIKGSLNDTDMEVVKRLNNIVVVDFRETDISEISNTIFQGFSRLYTVFLPESLKKIGDSSFRASSLRVLDIPNGVETLDNNAFRDSRLRNVSVSNTVKFIGERAFIATTIRKIVLPGSVNYIGRWAFEMTGLREVIFEESDATLSMEQNVFQSCNSLKHVKLSKSCANIPISCFNNSSLKSIEMPEGVKTIGSSAFRGTQLESIVFPESLVSIGEFSFDSSNITSVVIPKNVTNIGRAAFFRCGQLKEVTLNSYANNLNATFHECFSLERIIVPSVTPPTTVSGEDPFRDNDKDVVSVIVPEFALRTYKVDPYWFQFRNLKSSIDISESDLWAIHGHLMLNSDYTMTGTPSIDLEVGGILDIAEDTPLSLNDVTYNVQEDVPACFLNESDQVTANSLTTKFYVPSNGKWYFFSPVTDVKMADVRYPATDSWVIYRYDGNRRATENSASGNWAKMTVSDVLKRGQGYIIQAAAAGTLHLPAATSELPAFFGLGEAPMSIDDNVCESAENAGWNLVGNPYPTYYDIYSIELQAPITVWDGSTYRAYSLTDDNYVLRPMQPFFVQKSSSDVTFAMPRGGRQGSNEVIRPHTQQINVVDPNRHKLNLEITRGNNDSADDYTRIVINEDASLAYEGTCDASKFMSMDNEVAQIYTIGENRYPLAINERPYADGNATLGVYIPVAGETYRISAVRADRKAWLYDNESKIEQDLTEGDYLFTATKSGEDNSRFSIRFAPSSSTAVEEMANIDVKVTGNEGSISVVAAKGASVAVYGADGVLISNAVVDEGTLEFTVAGGVYIVNVNGQSFKTIVK
ncbi:MAG: leucine-rich repeat domain-containing protein [Muribaculaceae bacterium]|nr:leucine-rich repeat domain-containing protein [Muribaculaceae bacterium]